MHYRNLLTRPLIHFKNHFVRCIYTSARNQGAINIYDSNIDILYKPVKWSKRENALQQHLEFIARESQKSKQEIPCELNISYGSREREKLDIYGTDLPDSAPIFIFYHGGYWQLLSKDISSFAAQSLYKHNIKTIVIGYSLCPEVTMYDIVKQIEQATKKCIDYAKNCGSRRIYMGGYSAGCHLITHLFSNLFSSLTQEDHKLFKGVILCGGIYDLSALPLTSMNKNLKLTFEDARKLSPMFQEIPRLNCTVYIVLAEYESPVFVIQSNLYYEKLRSKCKVILKNMKGFDHLDIIEQMIHQDYELVKLVTDMEKQY